MAIIVAYIATYVPSRLLLESYLFNALIKNELGQSISLSYKDLFFSYFCKKSNQMKIALNARQKISKELEIVKIIRLGSENQFFVVKPDSNETNSIQYL